MHLQINISTVEESLELGNAGTTNGDEITCWTVQIDTPHSLEKNEQVYILKPEVRQTTRYPPTSTIGDESSVPQHGPMHKRRHHTSMLVPIIEMSEVKRQKRLKFTSPLVNKSVYLSPCH